MQLAITIVYILNCFFLMLVVLLQAGRGGGLSVAGGAASATMFSSRGAATVLQKATVYSAVGFMVLSMVLAKMSTARSAVDDGVFEDVETVPALSATPEGGAADPGAAPTEAAPAAAPVEAAPPAAAPAEVAPPAEPAPSAE